MIELMLIPLIILAVLGVIALFILFWILMLIDAIKRKYTSEDEKIAWILVITLVGVLGALIYFLAVKIKDGK